MQEKLTWIAGQLAFSLDLTTYHVVPAASPGNVASQADHFRGQFLIDFLVVAESECDKYEHQLFSFL